MVKLINGFYMTSNPFTVVSSKIFDIIDELVFKMKFYFDEGGK